MKIIPTYMFAIAFALLAFSTKNWAGTHHGERISFCAFLPMER